MTFAFIPVFKPQTHKLYILRHCHNIVYLSGFLHLDKLRHFQASANEGVYELLKGR
jgi:hypothetical protein